MIGVTRLLAPNPGVFTGPGTNTYVVLSGAEAVIIDPGPVIASHVDAIFSAVERVAVRAVLVTHTHPDHAPAANPVADRLGAPALGFGPGPDFDPDGLLGDGDAVHVGAEQVVAVHTPGHTADHLCYRIGDVLFSGDHIMGGSTVVIEDAAAYLGSLRRLADMRLTTLHPGHGPDLPAGEAVAEYLAHRLSREREIVDAVAGGAATVDAVVDRVYADVPSSLRPAAVQQVIVQIRKLVAEGRLHCPQGRVESGAGIEGVEEAAG